MRLVQEHERKEARSAVVGRLTEGFPLVVDINALPDGFPATGFTRSFWDRGQDADDATELPEAA